MKRPIDETDMAASHDRDVVMEPPSEVTTLQDNVADMAVDSTAPQDSSQRTEEAKSEEDLTQLVNRAYDEAAKKYDAQWAEMADGKKSMKVLMEIDTATTAANQDAIHDLIAQLLETKNKKKNNLKASRAASLAEQALSLEPLLRQSATVDVSSLFQFDDGDKGGLHMEGHVLELSGLLKKINPSNQEMFLPQFVYIRSEMRQVFIELLDPNIEKKILSGSPGVGKSVLLFLVALYRVAQEPNTRVLYLRFSKQEDFASALLLEKTNVDKNLKITSSFPIDKNRSAFNLLAQLKSELAGFEGGVIMVDGPLATEELGKYHYLSTSGKGLRLSSGMIMPAPKLGVRETLRNNRERKRPPKKKISNVVLGGWQKHTLEQAVMACLDLRSPTEKEIQEDADEDYLSPEGVSPDLKNRPMQETGKQPFQQRLFEAAYYVAGGRIRQLWTYYLDQVIDIPSVESAISRMTLSQATLGLSEVDQWASSDHIDAVRTIFRRADTRDRSTDLVDIFVDSQFVMRLLQQKVDAEELLTAYKRAKQRGLTGTAANSFEELMHSCISAHKFGNINKAKRAGGTGREGVGELDECDMYWIPSIPNFVNIDSAIVRPSRNVWMFQFTIARSHSYIKRRLKSQFLNHIAIEGPWAQTTIFFVVPEGTNFIAPDVGDECIAEVEAVDCSSMESVVRDLRRIVERTIDKDSEGKKLGNLD